MADNLFKQDGFDLREDQFGKNGFLTANSRL